MTIANVNIKKVLFRRGNTIQNDNYVGVFGEVSVDTQANTLRVHNGVTAGGTRLATYAELTDVAVGNLDLTGYATTSQITAVNVEIGKLRANITAANVAWAANAATQAAAINTINANIGAFHTYANATFTGGGGSNYSNTNVAAYLTGSISTGNIIPTTNAVFTLGNTTHWWKELYVGSNTIYIGGVPLSIDNSNNLLIDGNIVQGGNVDAVNSNVSVIDANIGAYQRWANTNAAAQTTSINTTNANIGAYQIWANANAAAQTTSINTTNANIGAYQIWANANAANQSSSISAVSANVTAANSSIATIQANIGAYQTYANANAAAQTTAINLINANVTAANLSIAAVTTAWTANAGTQGTDINALRANITAANTAIATLQTQVYSNVNTAAYLTGAITTGNITAANVTVETNAVVLGNLRVQGTQTTVNAASLNITDLWVTVADGATQASDANGAGLRVEGALANIAYSSVSDSFEFNKQIVVGNVKFSDTTRLSGNTITLPNTQGFNWYFNDPMIGSDTVTLYMNGLTTGYDSWALTTGNGANAWMLDSDTQELYLFNGGVNGGKLVFGTAANAGVRSSIDDIEVKSAVGNVYIRANSNPWTFREDGNLVLPSNMIFTTSPAMSGTGIIFGDGSYQYEAWTGASDYRLVNGVHTAELDASGNLTVPSDILPLVDNLHDLGSATQRFRHLYVGPGTVYVGNAAIKTTATGNLILPGLTRPIASTAYAEEVDEEDDQTQTFNSVPTVIDNAHYSYLNGNPDNLSFTPAEYSVDQLDGEGYIDGITVTSPGVGYAGQVESLAEQDMWATEVATPLASFNAGDWVRIPFRVRSRAGESEYDFTQGGGSVDRLVNESYELVLDDNGHVNLPGGSIRQAADEDLVIRVKDADDDGYRLDLLVVDENDDNLTRVEVQRDGVEILTNLQDTNNAHSWYFRDDGSTQFPSDTIKASSGQTVSLSDYAGKNFVTVTDTQVVISAQDTTEYEWIFGQDGSITFPDNTVQTTAYTGGGSGNTGLIRFDGVSTAGIYNVNGGGITISNFSYQTDEAETAYIRIPDGNSSDALIINQEQGPVAITANTQTWEFGTSGRLYLPSTGSIEFSDGTVQTTAYTGGAGGNIAGLTSTVGNQAGSHGSTVYSLTLNSDNDEDNPLIEVYKGTDDNNSAISIGQSNSGFRQANVIAIGNDDVGYDALPGGVYIGYQAGWNDTEDPQGLHAIAIGSKAAYTFATNNSITLNATGNDLTPDESGLFIKPIREEQYDDAILYYNAQSGEVTYATNTGGGASIGNTAPTSVNGRLWYNTEDGRTYVYALDTWIDASPSVVPGNMVGYDTDGNITLRDDASINYANGVSIINSVYGDAEVAEFLDAYTGNIAKIGSDPLSLTAANIELSSDNETWRFASTGNIIFPDGSEQATAYTGGGGSSYGNVELAAFLTDYEGNIYINSESSGLIIDAAGDKRVGFMKYFGMESSFVHANGATKAIPFQIGRVAADDITQANISVFTSEIYIAANGKVGINTTGPTEQLDVNGVIRARGAIYARPGSSYGVYFTETGSSQGSITTDVDAVMQVSTSGGMVVNASGNRRLVANLSATVLSGGNDLIIESNTSSGTNTWTFDADGNLSVPGNINFANGVNILSTVSLSTGNITFDGSEIITSDSSITLQVPNSTPTGVANWEGGGGWNQSEYLDLATTGGTGSGLTVDVAAGGSGYINIEAITINTPGTGYTNGDVITIDNENNIPGTFTLIVPTQNWNFAANGTTTFPDHGAVNITGNLTVGNLTVNGNTTTINTQSYTVVDNIIQMAADNPADTLDLGFVAHRTVDSTLQHTGLIRDASEGTWKLFSNVPVQPGNTVDFTDAIYDTLVVGGLSAGNTNVHSVNFTGSPLASSSPGIQWYNGFQDAKFGNTEVAAYLVANPQTGTYSNTNVSVYLSSSTATVANLVISGSAPSSLLGSAGDTAGMIRIDSNYIYYCTSTFVPASWTVGWGGAVSNTLFLTQGDYPTPQVGWIVDQGGNGPWTIDTISDDGYGSWQITWIGTAYGSPTGGTATLTNPNPDTIWTQTPLAGTTYSNANIVANLQNFVTTISTTANIVTTANVIAPNYLFANGVNILSTVSAGSTYANADAAAYLAANTALYLGNPGTRYINQANVTQLFVGNATTIGAGSNQLGGTHILNNAYFGANGAMYARNTQTGAAQFRVSGGTFDWSGTTGAVTANSVQSFAIWAGLNSSTFTTYNSVGITSAGLITASAGLSITSTGITTSLSTFPLVNSTATTVNFGGAATTITAGATTVNVQVGGSTMRGNISAGNIIVGSNISAGNIALTSAITAATATATGNVTALNFITTGTYGNITGANVISANTVTVSRGVTWANGTAYSTYTDSDVAAYLPTYNGTLSGSDLSLSGGAWTGYTPVWSTSGTQPAIGNGLIEGRYKQIGKTVHVLINASFGSTTTFGTGEYKISLPVAARSVDSVFLNLFMRDSGTRFYNSMAHNGYSGFALTSDAVTLFWDTDVVTNTSPFTWANGDNFTISGTYEAA